MYLLLSRSGPLGYLGILHSPKAMIIAQVLLIIPIITGITMAAIKDREASEKYRLHAGSR